MFDHEKSAKNRKGPKRLGVYQNRPIAVTAKWDAYDQCSEPPPTGNSVLSTPTKAVSMKTAPDTAKSDETEDRQAVARGTSRVWMLVMAGLLVLGGGFLWWAARDGGSDLFATGTVDRSLSVHPIPARYDADRAFGYLVKLCDLGPRPTGSRAMKQQQELLTRHFEGLGGTVRLQEAPLRHPETGQPVPMANLIASWHTDRPKRFLLCAHYDTRPFPDRDRRNPGGRFVGANDGGSGVAALMEMAHHLDDLPDDVGVDVVMFDAEEFVFDDNRDKYFLGSVHFAQQYLVEPPAVPYQAGILLDMVADKELKLYFEKNSLRYAKQVTRSVWDVAERLGVVAFVARSRHEIRDDHLPLNQIAKIPTTDLIDFDYPRPGIGAPSYWHTEQDIPANCSGESMVAVVWVVHEWLKSR